MGVPEQLILLTVPYSPVETKNSLSFSLAKTSRKNLSPRAPTATHTQGQGLKSIKTVKTKPESISTNNWHQQKKALLRVMFNNRCRGPIRFPRLLYMISY